MVHEQGTRKWGWITFGFQMMIGYCMSLCVYQIGSYIAGGGFGVGTAVAIALVVAAVYFIFRPAKKYSAVGQPVGA